MIEVREVARQANTERSLKPTVYEVNFDLDQLSSAERIFIRSLGLVKVTDIARTYYIANTPDGRQEVDLTTVSFMTAIAYTRIDPLTNEKKIMATSVPGISKQEITRGRLSESKATYYFIHGIPPTEYRY